jgi:hypothetical protein
MKKFLFLILVMLLFPLLFSCDRTYTITLDLNGKELRTEYAHLMPKQLFAKYGEEVDLPFRAASDLGWDGINESLTTIEYEDFGGRYTIYFYNTKADGSGTNYPPSSNYIHNIEKDITLYMIWVI